jgi:dienelactone hydrolase
LVVFGLCVSSMASVAAQVDTISYVSRIRGGGEIALRAELRVPEGLKPPYRTLIVQHSSGPDIRLQSFPGRTDGIALKVGELALQRGYAVLFTDSFTPRGIQESNRAGKREIGSSDIALDIFFLVRTIYKDARIDINNLFFFGHSQGGGVGLDVSSPRTWRNARFLAGRATPFKAVASSAPACNIQREEQPGQPLKLFVGALDDWTPPKACDSLVKRYRSEGNQDVEIEIIPGVGHSYSTSGTSWRGDVRSFRGCVENIVVIQTDGRLVQGGKEITRDEYDKSCLTVGATSRGGGEKVPLLASKVLDFFNRFSGP